MLFFSEDLLEMVLLLGLLSYLGLADILIPGSNCSPFLTNNQLIAVLGNFFC